jgi:hypothetical protein
MLLIRWLLHIAASGLSGDPGYFIDLYNFAEKNS